MGYVRPTAARLVRKGHTIVCPADDKHEVVTSTHTFRFGGFVRIDTERHEHFRDVDELLGRVLQGEDPDD